MFSPAIDASREPPGRASASAPELTCEPRPSMPAHRGTADLALSADNFRLLTRMRHWLPASVRRMTGAFFF